MISPAAPAAALVCPICDLTDPIAHQGPARAAAKDLFERFELGRVADPGAGAVGLDQLDGLRRDARLSVSPAQRQGLAGGAGRVDGLALAVARGADRADHGVDAVAVALGFIEPLEHQHPQPLAQDRAVGPGVERPGLAAGREGRRLAEAHVDENVVERVDAPGHGEVAPAGGKLEHGQVESAQRAGAGGVDDAVGAAQVEAVGDAAGGDVAQQAGE